MCCLLRSTENKELPELSQPTHGLIHSWPGGKHGIETKAPFLNNEQKEAYLPPDLPSPEKRALVFRSLGRSATCPVTHCTWKHTISKPLNLHKMHFSVALLERKRRAPPRPQAPWGDRIPNKQNRVDIWTMAGPAHSEDMAKNSL